MPRNSRSRNKQQRPTNNDSTEPDRFAVMSILQESQNVIEHAQSAITAVLGPQARAVRVPGALFMSPAEVNQVYTHGRQSNPNLTLDQIRRKAEAIIGLPNTPEKYAAVLRLGTLHAIQNLLHNDEPGDIWIAAGLVAPIGVSKVPFHNIRSGLRYCMTQLIQGSSADELLEVPTHRIETSFLPLVRTSGKDARDPHLLHYLTAGLRDCPPVRMLPPVIFDTLEATAFVPAPPGGAVS